MLVLNGPGELSLGQPGLFSPSGAHLPLYFSLSCSGKLADLVVRGSILCATLVFAEALWAVHRHPQGAN